MNMQHYVDQTHATIYGSIYKCDKKKQDADEQFFMFPLQ